MSKRTARVQVSAEMTAEQIRVAAVAIHIEQDMADFKWETADVINLFNIAIKAAHYIQGHDHVAAAWVAEVQDRVRNQVKNEKAARDAKAAAGTQVEIEDDGANGEDE